MYLIRVGTTILLANNALSLGFSLSINAVLALLHWQLAYTCHLRVNGISSNRVHVYKDLAIYQYSQLNAFRNQNLFQYKKYRNTPVFHLIEIHSPPILECIYIYIYSEFHVYDYRC